MDDPAKAGMNSWGEDMTPNVKGLETAYREGRVRGIASGQGDRSGIRCNIWDTIAVDVTPSPSELVVLDSPRAGGKYGISARAVDALRKEDDRLKARLTSMLVDQRALGNECPEVIELMVSEAKRAKNKNVQQRADRLLQYIDGETSNLGDVFSFSNQAMICGAIAWSESTSSNEVLFLMDHLSERGRIRSQEVGKARQWTLSVGGYEHLSELHQKRTDSTDAFVAMWFDKSMDAVWNQGIKAGIQDAGYRPVRIDGTEHNDKIDDRIISQIQRSRFIVADFTQGASGARGGVYYEAGFARGLNLPVIFTCRKDLIDAVHFDTRQFNHITWESTDELRTRLADRISATIGDGPLRDN